MATRRVPPRRAASASNPAAQRAIRAATPREPWLPPGFAVWVAGRLLAVALLVGAAWLLSDFASSTRFEVRTVHVQGNQLLSRAEVQDAAGVVGANIFWVNRADVAARLRQLPLVQRVDVEASLPDSVDIHVVERQPAGFWTSGNQTYLVDEQGVILKAVDAETALIRACAGQACDPQTAPMPSVSETDAEPLAPGAHVDASALATSSRLAQLLPSVGVQPVGFEWNPDTGLEVPTADGWRARFSQTGNLDQQIARLRTIRDELTRTNTNAGLIDVRFGDRPYFR
ncbi:MAG: FtsQ-type POTRA domain-containing protein [Chloroflexi bacterium]|nr:FtsQ-type POTRA domain-containing protein [Chloroflexota bacterium]